MRISDWSSDVCSSDLAVLRAKVARAVAVRYRQVRHRSHAVPRRKPRQRFHLCRNRRRPAIRPEPPGGLWSTTYPAEPAWIGFLPARSEEHTSELQSLMRKSYAVFCLKKNKQHHL